MQILESSNLTCYDVDDTLVLWDKYGNSWDRTNKEAIAFFNPYRDPCCPPIYLKPNKIVIERLKTDKKQGGTIVVWSAGGWRWAKVVIETLELEEYVDLITSKPNQYVDDNPCTVWLNNFVKVGHGGKIE